MSVAASQGPQAGAWSVVYGFLAIPVMLLLVSLLTHRLVTDPSITASVLFGALAFFFFKLAPAPKATANRPSGGRVGEVPNQDRDRLEFILDSLNDVFWSFDLTNTQKNYVSRSAERVYGRPLHELINKPFFWTQYIHPADIHIQEECHRKLSKTGHGECTYRIIGADKMVRWIYSRERATRDARGNIIRVEGVSTDVSYLKQAEEIIEKQELQINAVVENLDMAIIVVALNGKILLINKQAEALNRINDRHVIVGMNFFAQLSPDRRESRRQIFDQVFASKSTINQVDDCPDQAGNVRYYSIFYIPVLGLLGEVEQVCVMSRDITSQKRIETEVKEKTELLRAVIDNVPDYVYVKDRQLRHVINNKANLHLIGAATEEETVGKKTAEYFTAGSCDQFAADDQAILDTGISIVNKEEEIIDEGGRKRWLLTTKVPLKNAGGEVTGIVGISRDISDRKQMELSLHLSNERFRMASQASDDAIWDWDIAANDAYLGENFKVLFGYDLGHGRVSLSEWSRHIHPEDVQRVLKSIEYVVEFPGNNRWHSEYRYVCADGTTAHVSDRAFVMRDDTGKAVRMIGAMQNVTEVVEYRTCLEQKVADRTFELNKALAKEKELVETKGRFVSMASHEFRTPLSAIQFAVGFLKKFYGKIKPEDIVKKLEGVENQVKIMTVLLDDMLTLNKTETGKLKITPVKIDLISFFDKIAAEIENVDGNHHKVVRKFNVSSLMVLAEEKFLRNIFVNLISNAIKFSPEKDGVFLTVEPGSGHVSITVRDEGIGISPADLSHIFEPFRRGGNANNISGTGLGLCIAKRAVEVIGGTISVDSKENAGSQFVIKLPTP